MKILTLPVIILLFSCAGTENLSRAENEGFPLMGMIYSAEGIPAEGAAVIMDGEQKAETDISGRFVIWRAAPGKHEITVKKKNFEELRTEIDFQSPSRILYASITPLRSIKKEIEDALQVGRLDKAGKLIERGFGISEDDCGLRFLKIIFLVRKGKYTEAFTDGENLLIIHPDSVPLILAEAQILAFGLGKPRQALDFLEKYSGLDDSSGIAELAEEIKREENNEHEKDAE